MKNTSQLASLDIINRVINDTYDEVSNVCCPLFKNTPIRYFAYERYYDSGKSMYLGTISDLIGKLIIGELLPSKDELQLFCSSGQKATFLSHHMPLPFGEDRSNGDKYQKMIAYGADCHIYNALFIIERKTDHYRFCGFGAKQSEKSVFNFYINSMPLLESFIENFEFQCRHLIQTDSENNLIQLPSYNQKKIITTDTSTQSGSYLQLNNLITFREMECLELIAHGYTMKNAAKKLTISPRTVEMHLRNIKEKSGLHTKNQLVDIWHRINASQVTNIENQL
ncbi:MAG: helix-turn-helix transcriptional regulator [Pseudomonadota bacterium]|nr:helix-turn-helix transcriptional regulator [Pseudomonadota bacterium]